MNRTANKTKKYRAGFAREHGMALADVTKLVRMGNKAGRLNLAFTNGEPDHPDAALKSTALNAKLWGDDLDAHTAKMNEFVKRWGFVVEYNGIYPSLVKDGRDGSSVFIPY